MTATLGELARAHCGRFVGGEPRGGVKVGRLLSLARGYDDEHRHGKRHREREGQVGAEARKIPLYGLDYTRSLRTKTLAASS